MIQDIGIGAWLLRAELGQLIPWPPDQEQPQLGPSSAPGIQHLPPRLVHLLRLLASQPGQLWRREELIEALWPDRVVNEEALSRTISQLRQALGDRSDAPEYIATVPKQGYRLVAQLRPYWVSTSLNKQQPPEHNSIFTQESDKPRAGVAHLSHTAKRPWRSLALITSALIAFALFGWFSLFRSTSSSNTAWLEHYRQNIFTARRITAHPGVEHFVEVSPDGEYLAYVAVRDGAYRAFIASSTDSDQWWMIPLSSTSDAGTSQLSPVFSPSGSEVALVEVNAKTCQLVIQTIYEKHKSTSTPGQERRLGPCLAQGLLPILDWSPDGQRLAFSAQAEGLESAALWELNLRDGSRHQLTQPLDAYHNDARPRYSPDQQYLSFSRGTNAFRELYLLPLNISHGERQLSFDHQYTQSHDWLNDGSGIVFDSDRDGERGLWLLTLHLAEKERDTLGALQALGARGAQYPSIANNNGALAYQIAAYEANLWPLNKAGLAGEALIRSTKYDNNPAFSPDGQWLAFASNRAGRGALWLARADGREARKLFEPKEGRAAWPVWSPQGQALFFILYHQGGQWLSRLDLAALTVSRLQLPHQGFAPNFSSDGQWFCYTALLPGMGTQVWRLLSAQALDPSLVSLQAKPISVLGANRGCTDDKDRAYFSRHGIDGIYRSELDGTKEQLLIPDQSHAQWQSWLLQGQSIFYLKQTEQDSGIWVYHIEQRQSQQLSQQLPTALAPNLAVSPLDQQIIAAMTDRAEADLFFVPAPSR